MPCVVFYLILVHLNSSFLDKDSVVSGVIDFNQKLVLSKLRFRMVSGGTAAGVSAVGHFSTGTFFSVMNLLHLMQVI